jgi:hypothetical protein
VCRRQCGVKCLGNLAALTHLRKTFRTLCASSFAPDRVQKSHGGSVFHL